MLYVTLSRVMHSTGGDLYYFDPVTRHCESFSVYRNLTDLNHKYKVEASLLVM